MRKAWGTVGEWRNATRVNFTGSKSRRRWCLLILLLAFPGVVAQNQLPRTAEEYLERGLAEYKSGRLADSLDDFHKAIELDPELSSVYYHRGIVRANAG